MNKTQQSHLISELPTIKLLGKDGNAYNILGLVKQRCKELKVSDDVIQHILSEMMGGDYNNLLRVVSTYFKII